ncbi:MAG: hypothetical protein AAFZ02_08875 [Pseudomonadota bacterium]
MTALIAEGWTWQTGVFVFVSVVTLAVTAVIVALMVRNPRAGLVRLDHIEEALPEVMAGRYICFFILTLLAVLHGDFLVMAGLQTAFTAASLADVLIYARRRKPVRPHVLAGVASAGAALMCGYIAATSPA